MNRLSAIPVRAEVRQSMNKRQTTQRFIATSFGDRLTKQDQALYLSSFRFFGLKHLRLRTNLIYNFQPAPRSDRRSGKGKTTTLGPFTTIDNPSSSSVSKSN